MLSDTAVKDIAPNGTSATQERQNKKPRLDSEFASSTSTTILEQDSEPVLYEGDEATELKSPISYPSTPSISFSRQASLTMSPTFSGIPGLTLISGEKTEEQVKQDAARSMEFEMTSPSPSNSVQSPTLKRPHPDSSEDVRMTSPLPPSAEQIDAERAMNDKTPVPGAKEESAPVEAEEASEKKVEEPVEEEFRFDSSDGSDSDDESSSDSDSDSDEEMTIMDPAALAKQLMEEADEDGDINDAPPKTKNEMDEEVIEIPDVKITENTKFEELGTVSGVVGTMMLIKAKTSGEYQVLNEKSVLATEDKQVFGCVCDTIGRVEEPMYTVMFNSSEQIASFGLKPGKTVYYLPEHSTFVFTKPLIGQKGSDASNIYDEEIPEEEQEFSDDEEEAARKKAKKNAKQKGKNAARNPQFDYQSTLPPLNYDDEPYVPLQRPPHLPNRPTQPPARPTVDSSFQNNNRDSSRNNRGGRGGGRGGWNNDRSGRDNRGYNDQRRPSGGDSSNQRSPVQTRSPGQQSPNSKESNQSYPSYGQWSQPPAAPSFSQPYLPQALYASSQSPPVTPFTPPALPPGAHINPAFFRNLSAPTSPAAQTVPQQQFNWPQPGQGFAANQQWPQFPPPPPPPPFPAAAPTQQIAPGQAAFPTPWLQSSVSPPPLQQPTPVAPVPQAPSPSTTSSAPTGSNDEAFKKIQDKLAILSQLGGI